MNKTLFFIFILFGLNISCTTPDNKQKKLFKLLDPGQTGIDFNNALEESYQMNVLVYQDFYSGGGVSIGDIDNDGLPDIFFTGNQVPSRLYKNLGNMKFKDITSEAHLNRMGRGWYTGTSMVDINHDGFLDIYISKSGLEAPDDRANLLYLNNGDGTFSEQAKKYGIDHQGFAVNASFFDYDLDGDLDFYLVNQGPVKLKSGNARDLRLQRHPEAGDVLFENIGDKFIEVTEQSGLYSSVIGFAHGVAIGDVNNDGWDDIFVSNDFFEHDYLYINNKDKTFTETIKDATKHISYYSMGNDMADYNNDGLLDIVVLDMIAEDNRRLYANLGGMNLNKFRSHLDNGLLYQYMSNVLHLNNGNESFSDVGTLAGISKTDWSWAPIFADFDNDGWKDLYVTNGIRKDVRNIDWGKFYFDMLGLTGGKQTFNDNQWGMLLNNMPYEPVTNYMFRNKGDLTFDQVMSDWGMEDKSWSNGVAYGDLDNDGDLDIVVNNIDQEAFVYENQQSNGHYIRFKFSGPAENPFGLGAKVTITHPSNFQYQQNYLARGYRSSMEPVMHFGLGADTLINEIEVCWPDGKMATYRNIKSDQVFELMYQDAVLDQKVIKKPVRHFFSNSEIELDIRHQENDMEDFMRAPTLPYKLSALGPTLAIGDVDGDGKHDFYLGGAFRRPGQMLVQSDDGFFKPSNDSLWNNDRMFEDIGACFFDLENDGDLDLYVVSGGSEHTEENGMLNDRLYINDGSGTFSKSENSIPKVSSSGSVAIPFDFDRDGYTDVFVGGRQVSGHYPNAADSYLLKNDQGKLLDLTDDIAPDLRDLGMVTDAVWTDYDGDGDIDLIVVGEWMPITIFNNEDGRFKKVSQENGLEDSAGWWWSIAAEDFDKDGDQDFVVGNMGFNYKFKANKDEPLEAYADDFDGDGLYDLAMGYYQNGKLYPVYDRSYAVMQMRSTGERIPNNDHYGVSTLFDIYGENALKNAQHFEMKTLTTSYMENMGNGQFKLLPLANQAQISNVNSILVQDVDGDNYQDIMLAGNLYPMDVRTVRNDGSIGLWLKGDGNGNFLPIPFTKSGLDLEGDIRNVEMIEIMGANYLIAAKNNDFIQLVKMHNPE